MLCFQAMYIARFSAHQGELTQLHEQLLIVGDLQKLKGIPVVAVMEQFDNTDSLRENDDHHHVWQGCWPVNIITLSFH